MKHNVVRERRFLRQAVITQRLQKHPGFFGTLEFGFTRELAWRIFDHVPRGETLSQAGLIPEGEAVLLLRKLLDIFSFAHSEGVCHCHPSADAIFFSADLGVAKLGQWGSAALVEGKQFVDAVLLENKNPSLVLSAPGTNFTTGEGEDHNPRKTQTVPVPPLEPVLLSETALTKLFDTCSEQNISEQISASPAEDIRLLGQTFSDAVLVDSVSDDLSAILSRMTCQPALYQSCADCRHDLDILAGHLARLPRSLLDCVRPVYRLWGREDDPRGVVVGRGAGGWAHGGGTSQEILNLSGEMQMAGRGLAEMAGQKDHPTRNGEDSYEAFRDFLANFVQKFACILQCDATILVRGKLPVRFSPKTSEMVFQGLGLTTFDARVLAAVLRPRHGENLAAASLLRLCLRDNRLCFRSPDGPPPDPVGGPDEAPDYSGFRQLCFVFTDLVALQHLDLSFNTLRAAGGSLFAAHVPPNLVTLNLAYCHIGSVGTKKLAENLARTKSINRSLRQLDLRHNDITDAGCSVLAQNIPGALHTLLLFGNEGLGDTSLQALEVMLETNFTLVKLSLSLCQGGGTSACAGGAPTSGEVTDVVPGIMMSYHRAVQVALEFNQQYASLAAGKVFSEDNTLLAVALRKWAETDLFVARRLDRFLKRSECAELRREYYSDFGIFDSE